TSDSIHNDLCEEDNIDIVTSPNVGNLVMGFLAYDRCIRQYYELIGRCPKNPDSIVEPSLLRPFSCELEETRIKLDQGYSLIWLFCLRITVGFTPPSSVNALL